MILFVVASRIFRATWRHGRRRRSGRQILDVMRGRREILDGDGTFWHRLLLRQQIGAGRNEIVRRKARLTDKVVDGGRLFLRRKRRHGGRRLVIVRQRLRWREDVDGRMRQIRTRQRRSTEWRRFRWWPVRRWCPEGRCHIHRRLAIMLLLLLLNVRW